MTNDKQLEILNVLEIEADHRDWEMDAARYEFEQYMEY